MKRSLATGQVADLFGLVEDEPAHTVAKNRARLARRRPRALHWAERLGKSSLLRTASEQLRALDVATLALPDVPLIDTLPGPIEVRLATLGGCGLSEARLLLRTPTELSEGERYRFRLAYAFSLSNPFVACDGFTATLDRTLAKVVAFNVRKLVSRTGVGVLAATTHDDIVEDLQPDVWVRCGDGWVEAERRSWKRQPVSFASHFWISNGASADWPHFARWHYRGHDLAFTRRVILLWHDREPVGICVFAAPAASLSSRTCYFGCTAHVRASRWRR